MGGALYRIRQFFQAVRAKPLDERALKLVQQYLPRAGVELYQTMPLGDQRHSLTVLRTLLEQGYCDVPLLQAALLHDVAKARVGLGYRTAVILLHVVSQKALARVASENTRSWRYPFYLSLHHPALGADMAARVGLDPRAVMLIRRHQVEDPVGAPPAASHDDPLARWQRALKAVDDQN